MSLSRHKRDWDEIAAEDPLWAILSSPEKSRGRWELEEFFATGVPEIAQVLQRAGDLGYPQRRDRALDFGCGYGRLTRAISNHFSSTVGVDISDEMISAAGRLNDAYPSIEFVTNDAEDLARFSSGEFDFIYSFIVLQHIPTSDLIKGYIREFVRIMQVGGLLVFQLPASIPFRYRLQPRRRAYSALRRLGVSPEYLRARLDLHPIRMNAVAEADVVRELESAGGRVLEIDRAQIEGFSIPSNTYWVTRE